MRALYLALGRDLRSADAGATHTLSIARALAAAGAEVTVAAKAARAEEHGVRVLEAPGGRRFGIAGGGPAADALKEAAARCDIIQERAEESGGAGATLARAAGKPLVLEVNTPLSGHPKALARIAANWNLRRQARAAAAIITQTPLSKSIIERSCAPPVYVVENGADGELFRPDAAPRRIEGSEGRRIVAFAGSMRPWHGVQDLIAAGARIVREMPEAFFLFVGGGPLEAAARGSARRALGAGSFAFTGPVAPEEVPGYLAAADALVAPFSPASDPVRAGQFARHGMWWSPVKIFEYMATGRPIVAAAAGMVGEYLAGTGLTYEPGDVEALAGTLLRVLGDEALRTQLGTAARRRLMENYTWRHAADKTLVVWRETLGGRQKVSVTA
jgi:glycosyltransferase involved in cell wall biosynthesis